MKFKTKFITAILLLLIFSCSEESKLNEKYDCISVDDCLSKYKFDGARAYMGISEKKTEDKSKDWETVISAESDYWIKEGEFKKAFSIIDQTINRVEYNSNVEEFFQNKIRMKAVSAIVDELNDKNEFNEARKWVLKCPDVAIDGFDYEANKKSKGAIRDVLNKKIDDYEKLSK